MKITIQAPEILIAAGCYMFPQSKWIALTLMFLGIVSAIVRYSMGRYDKDKTEKRLDSVISDYRDAMTTIAMTPIIKKSSGQLN